MTAFFEEVKYILKSKAIILDYRHRGLIKVKALFKLIWIKGLIHSEELVKLLETFLLINVRNNEKEQVFIINLSKKIPNTFGT